MCLSYFLSSLDEMFRVEGATGKAHADGAVVCPQLTGSGPPLPRFLPFSFETLETGPSRERSSPSPVPLTPPPPFFFYLRLSDRLRPLSRYLDAHIHIHNIYSGALLFIISFFLLHLLLSFFSSFHSLFFLFLLLFLFVFGLLAFNPTRRTAAAAAVDSAAHIFRRQRPTATTTRTRFFFYGRIKIQDPF